MKKISIIVPMYNEEEMVNLFLDTLTNVINNIKKYNFEIVAINDGSKDLTLFLLKKYQEKDSRLVIVDLSRNWGHEAAVHAGLKVASGDAVIPMDADLQDPPETINELIKAWENGFLVVNAKRKSRKKDSFFKRITAKLYYKFINHLSGKIDIPNNVGNFRLIDRKVVDTINELFETNRVFRTEVPFVGYSTIEIEFDRPNRAKGKTHYSLKSMVNLTISSIVSVTTSPLRWSLRLTIFFVLAFLGSGISELVLYCSGNTYITPAWYAIWLLINVILFIACFVFIALTIMSVYISDSVTESKRRPEVIINEVIKK